MIEFHCNHCGKLVRCGDEHAGKRGKCPACHQSVYIPSPPEQLEPLRMAPIDPNEEREKERLARESREVARRLMSERESPAESRAPVQPVPEPEGDARLGTDVETLVIEYAICMSDGNLSEAAELAKDIRKNMRQAEEVMQRITLDEIPPRQLAGIPRPVLVGFFKQLREAK